MRTIALSVSSNEVQSSCEIFPRFRFRCVKKFVSFFYRAITLIIFRDNFIIESLTEWSNYLLAYQPYYPYLDTKKYVRMS